jgi:Mlc titration factor MtfA (ptsG expression regulator)
MNLKNLFDNRRSLYNVFLFFITIQDEKKLQKLCQCFGQQQQFVGHLPFKLSQSMALILHIFLILLQLFFHYNFVKIVVETMIMIDDFFWIDCIK